jgi:hypothetical protein
MRLLGVAVGVAVLSVGAWLAVPTLRKTEPPPPAPPAPVEAKDAGATPAQPPVAIPDAGAPAKPVTAATRKQPTDPCAALRSRLDQVSADCRDPCDLDHYPMREDLDRCRACETLRAKVSSCSHP